MAMQSTTTTGTIARPFDGHPDGRQDFLGGPMDLRLPCVHHTPGEQDHLSRIARRRGYL
jgi:hypothetical protein